MDELAQRPIGPVREAVRTLSPGYFALVMATGILSISMQIHHQDVTSDALLVVGCVAYAVLVLLNVWRAVAFPGEIVADLADPRRAFGSFTFVAATDVLGTRLVGGGHHAVALAALAVGWGAWIVLGYVVPWTAVVGRARRPLIADANGTWFIWVVASQSVAVLAAGLEGVTTSGRSEIALLAVFSWSVGVFLYAAVGIFVAARLLVYDLRPADLTQPYWVAMGSAAISVVAGARIVEMTDAPTVDATRGLVAGASVLFWSFATWLIPPLLAAGWWRHVRHRIPLRYDFTWWSVVFPLGMYGVAGEYLGQADHLPALENIGSVESWFALAAWVVVFVAMLRHLLRTVMRPSAGPAASS